VQQARLTDTLQHLGKGERYALTNTEEPGDGDCGCNDNDWIVVLGLG
jgi:hypothetical protein